MKTVLAALLMMGLSSSLAAAQTAQATAPDQLMLELNGVADAPGGGCQMTIVTTNHYTQGLKRAAWQVAIFDTKGIVRVLPVLDFGSLPRGKTRVAVFPLAQLGCADIGRVVINDVSACQADDGTDLREICLSALATSSRTAIDFGL